MSGKLTESKLSEKYVEAFQKTSLKPPPNSEIVYRTPSYTLSTSGTLEQTDRRTDRQADKQEGKQTDRQADRRTDKQTDAKTDRHTDSQTDRH